MAGHNKFTPLRRMTNKYNNTSQLLIAWKGLTTGKVLK